jgi:hypothetical protein
MSNAASLEDMVNQSNNESINDMETIPEMDFNEQAARPSAGEVINGILEKLKTPTGEGDIEDYRQHVFNPKGSRSMAQILRGVTGIFGSLNFAIVDIILGFTNLQQERVKHDGDISERGRIS